MRKRTISLIIFAFVFLVAGWVSRDSIASASFQWYFKGYCRNCLNGELAYESVRHENGTWVFEHPTLTTKNNLEEGGFRFIALRGTIDATVKWWKRTIEFSIKLDDPHMIVGRGATDLRGVIKQPWQDFRFFHVHSYFNVPQGSIQVHESGGKNNVSDSLFYSMDLACTHSNKGCMALWFGKGTKENPQLTIAFSEISSKQSLLNFNFRDFDGALFFQFFQDVLGKDLPYTVLNGIVEGDLAVNLLANVPSSAQGDLKVKNISFSLPGIETEALIPEAVIKFNSTVDKASLSKTSGQISIGPHATITISKGGNDYWKIGELTSSFTFKDMNSANLIIDGVCINNALHRHLHIDGNLEEGQMAMSLMLQHLNDDENMEFIFVSKPKNYAEHIAEMQLKNFSQKEFDLVQYLTGDVFPGIRKIKANDGILNLNMQLHMHGLTISQVKLEQISLRMLSLSIDESNLLTAASKITGALSFDLSKGNPLETLNADLIIENGEISVGDPTKKRLDFEDIHTDFKVIQGVIQKSVFSGNIAGLKGKIEVDGSTHGPFMTFDFGGKTDSIIHLFPDVYHKGIRDGFGRDTLEFSGIAKATLDGLLFDGKLLVKPVDAPIDEITFGFSVQKSLAFAPMEWNSNFLLAEYCSFAAHQGKLILIPDLNQIDSGVYGQFLKNKCGINNLVLSNGRFEANGLKLEKYLSPFLFLKNQMQLSGLGYFQGRFNNQASIVRYDVNNLVLKNDDLVIEVKTLGAGTGNQDRGVYVVDGEHQDGFGVIPVKNATYFERNSGLLFTDINAMVYLKSDFAHIIDVDTFCNGVYFAGKIDVDWRMPGDGIFEVDLSLPKMHGKISQIQNIFSHFNKSLFLNKVPLEGNVDLEGLGGILHFDFNPEKFHLKAIVDGSISDARLTCQTEDVSLQEVGMNFKYNHEANTLDFSDIQGTLLVGSSKHVEEYIVSSDLLSFTDYENNETEFDIWVGDKKRDIIRFAGKTRSLYDGDGKATIDFKVNHELTHFGDAHPSVFKLTLRDWSEIAAFRLEFSFQLQSLLADLQRFSRSGLLFLSRSLLKSLNDIKHADGSFKAVFGYDVNRSLFNYNIAGNHIAVGSYNFDQFLLTGNKKGSTWTVDQLQFDDISLAVDFTKHESVWNINFLGARFGKSLLLGLEGVYRPEDSSVDAKINLLEVDLSKLNEWNALKEAVDGLQLAGYVHASGDVHIGFDRPNLSGLLVDLKAKGSLHHGKIKGLDLKDIKDMSLDFSSEKGITLSDISTSLKSVKDGQMQADLLLEKACCRFVNQDFIVEGLSFKIPASNLPWLTENLQQSLPEVFSPTMAEVLKHAKTEGVLGGTMRLSLSESHYSLQLKLNDDNYRFMGEDYPLSKFVLDYDPFSFRIVTDYLHRGQKLGVEVTAISSGLNIGDVVIKDAKEMLTIGWQIDPQNGYYINKIEGGLCGITCNLVRDQNRALAIDNLYLVGRVDLNFKKLPALMDESLAARIKSWELGQGYAFQGQWSYNKGQEKNIPFMESFAFQGDLVGSDIELMGYQFSQLSAQVTHAPEATNVRHFLIADACGSLQIDEMTCFQTEPNVKKMVIPLITVKQYRPSLMRFVNTDMPRVHKTLVINPIEIQNFSGILGERKSFIGRGSLNFVNPIKKDYQHTILAIPADILTRIGLDPEVLTPVKGRIDYEIKNGKIFLTSFKDMYSKKKVSKFYLSSGHSPSYVDFDGNMYVNVGMKQYNLIFKLAELFTVTVQGTLKKPIYNLQRQEYEGKTHHLLRS